VIEGRAQVCVRLWHKCHPAILEPLLERSAEVTQRRGTLVQLYMQPRGAPELHWLSLDATALPATWPPPEPPASARCASARLLARADVQGRAAVHACFLCNTAIRRRLCIPFFSFLYSTH
jgi:hypothetical protein